MTIFSTSLLGAFGLVGWSPSAASATESHRREYTARLEVSWTDEPDSDRDRTDSRPQRAAEAKPSDEAPPPVEMIEPAAPPETPPRAALDFELSGLLGAVISHRTGGLTFGGPRLGFRVGHFAMGLSFYPSLLYTTYRERHRIRPGLGFGLELAYRGVTLFAPVYHVEDRYLPAFGIGYRFHLFLPIERRKPKARPKRRHENR